MRVRFWGTRGSIATPEREMMGYGGNTSCVEVMAGGTLFIFDIGTGARRLGMDLLRRGTGPVQGHIFLTHTHWDHIQGFPFFAPVFIPGNEFRIFGPGGFGSSLEVALAGQMQYLYFPVDLNDLGAKLTFQDVSEETFAIGDCRVRSQFLNHTIVAVGYRLEAEGRSVAYITDHEPHGKTLLGSDAAAHERVARMGDPIAWFVHQEDQRLARFLHGVDLLIHDAQYTPEEYQSKVGWGHSSIDYVTDVAIVAQVKRLALYHHDPLHTDAKIEDMVAYCQSRVALRESPLEVLAAAEGLELSW